MKDHEIRELVDELTATARTCAEMQQLRARIARLVVPVIYELNNRNQVLENELSYALTRPPITK